MKLISHTDLSEPERISVVIFDLGNVIVDLDMEAVTQGFLRLTDGHDEGLLKKLETADCFLAFECGLISEKEFYTRVCDLLQIEVSFTQFEEIWNSMLAGIPAAKIDLLKALRQEYRVLVLSNTNAIHEKKFDAMIRQITGNEGLKQLVDRAYYSHEIHLRKPEPEIYQTLIDQQNISRHEAVFFDDKLENVDAARREGLKAVQVKRPEHLWDYFG